MNINWYPGHMKKSEQSIKESLSLVDIVYEIIDSRIPYSSRNPDLDRIIGDKVRLVIMNKSDLANSDDNNEWMNYFANNRIQSVLVDSITKKGINSVFKATTNLMEKQRSVWVKKGMVGRPTRAMIVGIPNVGKSTLINSLIKRRSLKVGDKPGVTKSIQWIRVKKDLELLDTPGILWPRFEEKEVGINLALTGAIKGEILDVESLAFRLIEKLNLISKSFIENRYNIELKNKSTYDIMLEIGESRGCFIKGGEIDLERTSNILLDEFRKGVIGRITLELPY